MKVTLFEAEDWIDGVLTVTVPVGTEVNIGEGWVVTIMSASLRCDCGKGVLCPMNPVKRVL